MASLAKAVGKVAAGGWRTVQLRGVRHPRLGFHSGNFGAPTSGVRPIVEDRPTVAVAVADVAASAAASATPPPCLSKPPSSRCRTNASKLAAYSSSSSSLKPLALQLHERRARRAGVPQSEAPAERLPVAAAAATAVAADVAVVTEDVGTGLVEATRVGSSVVEAARAALLSRHLREGRVDGASRTPPRAAHARDDAVVVLLPHALSTHVSHDVGGSLSHMLPHCMCHAPTRDAVATPSHALPSHMFDRRDVGTAPLTLPHHICDSPDVGLSAAIATSDLHGTTWQHVGPHAPPPSSYYQYPSAYGSIASPTSRRARQTKADLEAHQQSQECHYELEALAMDLASTFFGMGVKKLADDDFLFVDQFSGTHSMAKAAPSAGFRHVLTTDIMTPRGHEPPTDRIDVNNWHDRSKLETKIAAHMAQGRLVYVHMSPPCQAFSIANQHAPQLQMDLGVHNLQSALDLVRHTLVYTVENPATGRLWRQWDLRHPHAPLLPRAIVNYCMYGERMPPKGTGFAFSQVGFARHFSPKKCNGHPKKHAVTLKNIGNKADRSIIPEALSADMLTAACRYLKYDVTPAVNRKLLALHAEQTVMRRSVKVQGPLQLQPSAVPPPPPVAL